MRIVVHGHLGMGNLGDELMLLPILETLADRFPDAKLVVVAGDALPDAILEYPKIEVVPRTMLRLCVEIARARVFVVAGGTHLASFQGASRHLRGILRQLLMVLLAKLTFSRVFMLSVGFGPFKEPRGERLAKLLLSLTNYVSVRDDASVRWLESLERSKDRYDRCHDAALYTDRVHADHSKLRLGISLMPYFANYGGEAEKDEGLIEQLTPIIREWLESNSEGTVCLFSFLKQESIYSDSAVLAPLKQNFANNPRVELIDETPSIRSAQQQFASFTHFISMRYHSEVLAWLNEVPQLCITYHRKNRLFAKDCGIAESACFDVEEVLEGRLADVASKFFLNAQEFAASKNPSSLPLDREHLFPARLGKKQRDTH